MLKNPIIKNMENFYFLAQINLENCISKKHELKDQKFNGYLLKSNIIQLLLQENVAWFESLN